MLHDEPGGTGSHGNHNLLNPSITFSLSGGRGEMSRRSALQEKKEEGAAGP